MQIRVLDQHTAELIAAGEVVERPSSVIKELVENSLDAGAKNITVEIEKGGLQLMRIQDDGSGIPESQVSTAFLRHATSKVWKKEDLEAISTLGFRGEALASIASVSKTQILTKKHQQENACFYSIAGGKEVAMQTAARPTGTSIEVRELFYNTPARMKFLKKDSSEGAFVTETITRLALSNAGVSFRYIKDGKRVFSTPGDSKLQSAVYAVLGSHFAKELVEVEGGSEYYRVQGLITPPRNSRASRTMQFFYINGRFVKNRTIMAALEQAYRGMLMGGKFPGGILFLTMPPQLVDVNVHPAKTEVRFAKEGDVFSAVYSAVKAALLKKEALYSVFEFSKVKDALSDEKTRENASRTNKDGFRGSSKVEFTKRPHQAVEWANQSGQANFLASDAGNIPYQAISRKQEYALNIEPDFEDADDLKRTSVAPETKKLEELSAVPALDSERTKAENKQILLTGFDKGAPEIRVVGEVFKTYVVCQIGEKLCFVDKHAAHERIIYEGLLAQRGKVSVQQLLEPLAIELSAEEKNALLQNQKALIDAGMELEDFGGNAILIRGVAADIKQASVQDWAIEVAQRLILNDKDTDDDKTDWVLHSVACRAAIKAGDTAILQDLLRLVEKILDGSLPLFCPHGRPVVLEITRKELEKQFGRLG